MNSCPLLEFNLLDVDDAHISEIKCFEKDSFDA